MTSFLRRDLGIRYFNAPVDGGTFSTNDIINFNAVAIDPETGYLLDNSIVWTSSLDGQITTGASFNTSALSSGVHVITLEATDEANDVVSSSMTITINDNAINIPYVGSVDMPDFGLGVFLSGFYAYIPDRSSGLQKIGTCSGGMETIMQ